MRVLGVFIIGYYVCCAWAGHGYALWGDLKYPAEFHHFAYVEPNAPKSGTLRLVSNLRASSFDKYNPFTVKGNAPAYLADLMFDSLLVGSLDETAAGYGLLAQDVSVAADGLSVVFQLRPQARFHNGDPVLATDVQYSFEMLTGPYSAPAYKTLLDDVAGIDVLDAQRVRYRFKKPNRELPLTVGSLPVFGRKWGMQAGSLKRFDQIVMDTPLGSGPYRLGPVRFGKDVTYVRDPAYWAKDLNVRRGMANFDRITVKIYKDNTAKLEALKAAEFDLMRFFSAGDWARRVQGPRFASGELVKQEFQHRLPSGFQSYVLNSRRPKLQDARVRQALGLALDFAWMNRQLFYNAYQRVRGLFDNTDCQAQGLPSPQELTLLEPWRSAIAPEAFNAMRVPEPGNAQMEPSELRERLRHARDLLAQAGWRVSNGVLRDASGQAMELEYLDSNENGARVVTPWARNLEKLGIKLVYRAVDFALYQQRLNKFEFDITTVAYAGTHNPGQEFADLFGSQAAKTENSGNLAGVSSPLVDDLIARMTRAQTKAELLPACRALERVIVHSHYFIPQWAATTHRMAFNQRRLAHPASMPPYASGEIWALYTWWAR